MGSSTSFLRNMYKQSTKLKHVNVVTTGTQIAVNDRVTFISASAALGRKKRRLGVTNSIDDSLLPKVLASVF